MIKLFPLLKMKHLMGAFYGRVYEMQLLIYCTFLWACMQRCCTVLQSGLNLMWLDYFCPLGNCVIILLNSYNSILGWAIILQLNPEEKNRTFIVLKLWNTEPLLL